MKRISSILLGVGLVALQGCSAAPGEEDIASTSSAVTPSGSAKLTITSDWGSGYCANVDLTNALTVATTRWQVIIDFKGLAVPASPWNTTFEQHGALTTAHPASYNTSIAPNGTASFGFCGNSVAGGVRPVIKAYNMEANYFTTCQSSSGLNPGKAALAVAMATELGRWEPDLDLAVVNGRVVLSSTAVCVKNSCKNTKGLLGQQDYTPDQNIFNSTNFCEDLKASFQRQKDLITNLTNNNKAALPISNYKLTLVGGPTSLGYGNCGPHYIYQVDYSSGTNVGKPLTSTDAANLINTMCFFGAAGCGNNPYIGYVSTNVPGCASGKTCIAIDPLDGDNGSTSTTTAGSAPTYPMNRVYDPAQTLLGTACITTAGLYGTMQSKCSAYPTTCNYVYCTAS